MTRDEFEKEFEKQRKDATDIRLLTDEQYRVIESVYTYHPAISETKGKTQVAWLMANLGLSVFYDMLPRAEKAMELEEKIQAAKSEARELEWKLKELKKGAYSEKANDCGAES